MAEFDTDFMVPNGTEDNGTTHYDKVNFTTKGSLVGMTGYTKPQSASAVSASDNVVQAIGKLEKGIEEEAASTAQGFETVGQAIDTLEQAIEDLPTGGGKREPFLTVDRPSIKMGKGQTTTVTVSYKGNGTISAASSSSEQVTVAVNDKTVSIYRVNATAEATVTITLAETQEYYGDTVTVAISRGMRYGYRIKESEASPSARVEYLYDAIGMTPCAMNFSAGVFDYGSWGDAWFVTDNKPLMLKRDGTVDYYLNPNNYAYKEDGTASDVSNTAYDGNAMMQMPTVWVHRYNADGYNYCIFSDTQFDENYKADAHVKRDGTVGEYFYYSAFGASGNASMLRSLAGQTRCALTMDGEFSGAGANGSTWSTHPWSRYNLLRDLAILMGKSTDLQTVYGNGNLRSSNSSSSVLQTGTLKDKGGFFGYNDATHQVKIFHTEAPWGDQWDRLAGILVKDNVPYVQMNRSTGEYSSTSISGYTSTGVTVPSGMNGSQLKTEITNQYGTFPAATGGSASTYQCSQGWSATGLRGLLVGGGAGDSVATCGGFAWVSRDAPSYSSWHYGCGLSSEMPAA